MRFGKPGDLVYRIESNNLAVIMAESAIMESNEDFVSDVRGLLDIASNVRESRQLAAIGPTEL